MKDSMDKNINIFEKCGFFSALIVGFLTHSFIFYNKISYLDDCVHYFDLGFTYSSGRWGLGIIKAVQDWLELPNISMSFFNGFLSIFCLAIIAVFFVRMLKIEKKIYAILIGIYLVVFPAVTSTFAYMFTAPYYFFAALLMVFAVYFVHKSNRGMIPSILMISFAMGIYQAYIGLAVTLFVMVLLIDARNYLFRENMIKAVRCFVSLVLGIVLYFILNYCFINIMNVELNQYQGINDMTNFTVDGIISGVIRAYKIWPQLIRWNFAGISDVGIIRSMYAVCLVLFAALSLVYVVILLKKKEIWNVIYVLFLLTIVPLSIGIIFVMVGSANTTVHTLMIYNFVVIPIYPIALLQNMKNEEFHFISRSINWMKGIAISVLCIMSLYYAWLDNAAYSKANYQQESAIAYYTVMLSEIKGTEGYSDELPVIFLGNLEGQDSSIYTPAAYENVHIQGYHANMHEFFSYFAKAEIFMPIHLGYRFDSPKEPEKIYQSKYVKKMPCYPEDGSIQVVDGVVVIKLSQHYQ